MKGVFQSITTSLRAQLHSADVCVAVCMSTKLAFAAVLLFLLATPALASREYHIWHSPDSLFKVGGFTRVATEKLPMVMPERPPGFEGWRLIELMIAEPGEWLQFGVSLRKIPKVVFSRGARIILTDKKGRRIESAGLFFCSDKEQVQVHDTRERDVVVSLWSTWTRMADSTAAGSARFPRGSVAVKNIVSFEVVGARAASTEYSGQRR
ncbi:MAG: hypothetical protein JW952_00155 [Candidatus Eisenbacteria bacterium]|nr:hypothetical protein [Candidatus Eisenbacteria bacterium]